MISIKIDINFVSEIFDHKIVILHSNLRIFFSYMKYCVLIIKTYFIVFFYLFNRTNMDENQPDVLQISI